MSARQPRTESSPEGRAASDEHLLPYLALARRALADGSTEARDWVEPLARLLQAAAAGIGHLDLRTTIGERDPAARPHELLAIEDGRLMLPRTAAAWRRVRAVVEDAWRDRGSAFDDAAVAAGLDAILPPEQLHDAQGAVIFDNRHQRLAAAALVDARVGVLTGGPGTGKTTSAAALLALRARLDPALGADDVLVCAPTGKAANRLRLALATAADRLQLAARERELLRALRPRTIHRALGWSPVPPEDGGPFRHGTEHPLPQRLVLVDEASMADVELMAALLQALRNDAALIILGDRDQLESVAAGGVLAELVARGAAGELAPAQARRLAARVGDAAANHWREGLPAPKLDIGEALPGLAVGLRWSYRARSAPWILALADLVRPGGRGDAAAVARCCADVGREHLERFADSDALLAVCRDHWRALRERSADWRPASPPDPAQLQAASDAFQLLVATNAQVERAARQAARLLDHPSGPGLPHGAPLIVEANDRALDLANGDIGLAIGDGPGTPARVACFPSLPDPLPLARLPRHRAAWAITVHKSQGSEWQAVAIDLPDHADELLDRHLLYTAITRSAGWIGLHASDATLSAVLASDRG